MVARRRYSVALKSITGKPASRPLSLADSRPFWTPGMNSFGTEPPTIVLSNTKPEPGSPGSNMIFTRANWPVPPVCFLCV